MASDDGAEWPLSGLRVLELATEIAGPYCGKLLVDAGADVIKAEHPDGGDPLRRWTASGHALAPDEDGALFQFLNASKQSISLAPESESGRAELLELAAGCDLVIESFGAGGLAGLGLEPETLQTRNRGLSIVSISPFGLEGPHAARPASEFTLQAATGSIAYRGLADRKPVHAGGRIGEWAAGSFAAVGALAAWCSARNTGRGQHVDVSIFESMLLCLTVYHDLNSQWVEGPLGRSIEIPSIERAKDGWVGFCTITGQQWKDFCAMIGRQDMAETPALLDNRVRMQRIDEMKQAIEAWTSERTIDEILEIASLIRVPAAPVGNGATLTGMEQLRARGVYGESPQGFTRPRPPYQLERTPLRPLGLAPRLGADSAAVRAQLARAKPRLEPGGEGLPSLPCAGLRVLDMTAFWAGPMATSVLADLGADVVKVESIQRPDGMRFAGAARSEQMWEWSPVFHGANTGKRDVTLQLDSQQGLALVERLIAGADVMMENFSARVMESFGLGWEAVREINPGIIMVRMPAFGLDGPWRDRPGFAMTVEQMSGLAWITGYHDMPLVVRGACDPLGGMHGIFALLLALEHRRRTGEGQLVELPLIEVAVNLSAEQVIEHSAYGALLTRDENRGPVSAPQGVYACADAGELVALAIPSDEAWRALVALLGQPTWALDPALSTCVGRRARHDELDRRLEAWLADKRVEAAVEALLGAGIPAARAINAHELMPNPQLEARGFYQTMQHPVTGETRYPGLPMRFSTLARGLHRRPAPTLGQHNEEILCGELGLSREQLDELRQKQIVGERPSFM